VIEMRGSEPATESLRVDVDGNKYTVIQDSSGHCRALRYGERWLDLTSTPGSNMIMSLAWELRAAREAERRLLRLLEVIPPRPMPTVQHEVDWTDAAKARFFDAAQATLYADLEQEPHLGENLPLAAVLHEVHEVEVNHPQWRQGCQLITERLSTWVRMRTKR
jgi:hypothetical protein